MIFTNTFGMWMARRRWEIAWKSRDKVDSKKSKASSLRGTQVEHQDGKTQVGVRRSARILERKVRAEEPQLARTRIPDGEQSVSNVNQPVHSPARSLAALSARWQDVSLDHQSVDQLASVTSQPSISLRSSGPPSLSVLHAGCGQAIYAVQYAATSRL